jgi:hypothetical protein
MAGFLGGGSSGSGAGGEIKFPTEFIDPVTKLRVSQPETLIDTDFEYGLKPTKWETVELINNTPSFFSKSGDTTINGILAMVTTATSREVKVTTADAHGLAVGIPINVSGTKSITADGSYIINSIPDPKSFTYLAKQNQDTTASIFDLYTSIITGEFFQGSQIKISDSQGIVTNAGSPSVLTVQTDSPHGFQVGTPFYFLNLNSTVSQQFDASNTGAKTFDSSNSATAQTFDGSNTLTTYLIDLANKAIGSGNTSTVATFNAGTKTITVTHNSNAEFFSGKPVGTALYYNVTAASGYLNTFPRGIVYIADNGSNTLGGSPGTSTFSISSVPGGTALDIPSLPNGTFQLATQATTFAGNNTEPVSPTSVNVVLDTALTFDGANTLGSLSTVNTYSGTIIQLNNDAGSTISPLLFVGQMLQYTTTGTAASGLVNGNTYWITYFNEPAGSSVPGFFQIKVTASIGGADITVSGGSGTQKFRKIGVSTDTDTFFVPGHGLAIGDMVKYNYPVGGRITTSDTPKEYYFVEKVLDTNNIQLTLVKGSAKDGSSASKAATSALAILAARPNSPDGAYWIKPDGYAGDPFQVWCNMTLEGGGWMLALRLDTNNFGAASRTPFNSGDVFVGNWAGWGHSTKAQIDGSISNNATNYTLNNGTDAFSPVYIASPFNDVMVIANRDPGRRLGWRHNTQIPNMRSVIMTTNVTLGNSQLFATNGGRAGYWQPTLDKRSDTQGTTDRGFNLYGFKIGSDYHGANFARGMTGGWPSNQRGAGGIRYELNGWGGWYNAQIGWAATDENTAEVVPQIGGGIGGMCAAGSYHRFSHHVWGWGSSRSSATWDPDRSSAYYGHAVYVRERPI